ncbi:MAG TPA: DsrE family protein [Gammaproteobacteria bacterium]|nr:DsrE family protein [Gammaproteobacteria bacterium]
MQGIFGDDNLFWHASSLLENIVIYTLIITSNHLTTGRNALHLAQDLIMQNAKINRVYFLFDGAFVANKYIDMPTDEFDLTAAWTDFAQKNKISLAVCKASGLRRGISDHSIAASFSFGSIGELVESCAAANEVLTL